jgi:hypothetical protein
MTIAISRAAAVNVKGVVDAVPIVVNIQSLLSFAAVARQGSSRVFAAGVIGNSWGLGVLRFPFGS